MEVLNLLRKSQIDSFNIKYFRSDVNYGTRVLKTRVDIFVAEECFTTSVKLRISKFS